MSRSHRTLSTLFALALVALSATVTACGTEGSIGVNEDGFEANPDNKPLPEPDVFAQWEAPAGASATVLAAPSARTAAASASLGTNLDLGDDNCANVPLGFDYLFYGGKFTTVWVCANGNITLNVNNTSNAGLLPQPNVRMLAPATGDWTPERGTANNVWVQTVGTAPGRRFIVTWNNVRLFNSPSKGQLRSTFRAVLHETTNLAELQYEAVRELRTDKMRAGISAGTSNYLLVATGAEIFALEGKSVCFTPAGTSYTRADQPCPLVKKPNAAPTADAGGPYAAEEGSPILFNGALSSDPDGDPLAFAWTFGDGAGGAGSEVSHVYADQGSYPVSLVVADPEGLTSEASVRANVYNVAPRVALAPSPWLSTGAASLVPATPVVSGETVTLSASFADPGVVDAPWTWTIAWGDGGTYTGTSEDQAQPVVVERRLLKPGSYTVTVSMEDKDHDVGTVTGTFTVTSLPIEIDIKPGDESNTLNSGSNGKFWVAVLGSPSLDASRVDVATVTLGGASPYVRRGSAPYRLEDVDGDGDADLLLQFETQAVARAGGLSPWTETIELRATLVDGREASGSDPVRVVR